MSRRTRPASIHALRRTLRWLRPHSRIRYGVVDVYYKRHLMAVEAHSGRTMCVSSSAERCLGSSACSNGAPGPDS